MRDYFMHTQPDVIEPAKLLTSNEVADRLGVKPTTMEAWRCRGEGPDFIKIGRLVRYKENHLQAWLDLRTRAPDEAA
jgi:predicted DNA-binding transcriptional regulator AlpA